MLLPNLVGANGLEPSTPTMSRCGPSRLKRCCADEFEQTLAQENDERLELSFVQVFVVEIDRDPWIAVWRFRVTTRPR